MDRRSSERFFTTPSIITVVTCGGVVLGFRGVLVLNFTLPFCGVGPIGVSDGDTSVDSAAAADFVREGAEVVALVGAEVGEGVRVVGDGTATTGFGVLLSLSTTAGDMTGAAIAASKL